MKTTFDIKQVPETKFGCGCIDNLENSLERMGAGKVLLIVDKQMQKKGLTQKIENLLDASRLSVKIHVIDESILSLSSIEDICESVNLQECDSIVGYGGWRSTDLAKIVSIIATNGLKSEDLLKDDLTITNHGLPVISIPTTPPNGAEIDTKIYVRNNDTQVLHAVESPFLAPRLTIIDPNLMVTLPRDLTASTGIDSLSHAIEAVISMNASPFSEILALQAIALLKENLVDAFRQPDNLRARYNVALGSLYSALALNMTGSGLIHALAYPLTARYGISHPQASALMSLHALKYNVPVVPDQFIRIARLLGCKVQGLETDAQKAIEAFEELLSFLEHPIHLSSYKIPGIDLQELSQAALNHSECIKGNPRVLSLQDILMIYRNSM